jgi:small subunit ribosomal protein S20
VSSTEVANRIARYMERRRLRNSSVKTRMKTAIGGAEKLIKDGEVKSAGEGVMAAIGNIDRAVSKGVIHRNKGARLKSRLAKKLNQATPKKRKKKGG